MALVVGIGNPTRTDDGAGLSAAAEIGNHVPEAEILEVQQLTPEIAERVAAHTTVIFLDASVQVDRVTVTPIEPRRADGGSHGSSPAEILAIAEALYGARPRVCVALEIPARDFAFGERLSAETAIFVEEAVRLAREILTPSARPPP